VSASGVFRGFVPLNDFCLLLHKVLQASLVQSKCAVGRNPDKPSSPLKSAVKRFCLLLQKASTRRGMNENKKGIS